MTEHHHDCPACDHTRTTVTFHGLLGWVVAIGFLILWLTDGVLSRILAAVLIEWMP